MRHKVTAEQWRNHCIAMECRADKAERAIERMQAKWPRVLKQARKAARRCGYALAVHGSLERDLDVVAIPWTEIAGDAGQLVEDIRIAVGGYMRDDPRKTPGTARPHGRRAYTILACGSWIDLSVMPLAHIIIATHRDNCDSVCIPEQQRKAGE